MEGNQLRYFHLQLGWKAINLDIFTCVGMEGNQLRYFHSQLGWKAIKVRCKCYNDKCLWELD